MPDDPIPLLSANVRRLRKQHKWSQERVANNAGLQLSDVGRIERGERDPGVRVLVKLARGLEVSVSDLLAGIK